MAGAAAGPERLSYENTIERTLFSQGEIAAAIARLAESVARDYSGQPLLLLGVLKGALYVTVDLVRAISRVPDGPSQVEPRFFGRLELWELDPFERRSAFIKGYECQHLRQKRARRRGYR